MPAITLQWAYVLRMPCRVAVLSTQMCHCPLVALSLLLQQFPSACGQQCAIFALTHPTVLTSQLMACWYGGLGPAFAHAPALVCTD